MDGGYFDRHSNGRSPSLGSPATSPLPVLRTTPDGRSGVVEKQAMEKAIKTVNSLVATLAELSELNAATAKAQKELAKQCKELSTHVGEDMDKSAVQEDVIVNALSSASAMFASLQEVTLAASKKTAKESQGLRESAAKMLKRISKDERDHEDHVEQLEAKIRRAASAFDKSRKPSHRHSFDAVEAAATSERYLGSMSAWGAEIAQAKQSQSSVRSIRRGSLCRLVVRSTSNFADTEWRKTCDQVRKAGQCVGDLVMWSNFCAADGMPTTVPPSLSDDDSDPNSNTTSASSSSFHTDPSVAGSKGSSQSSPPRLERSMGSRPPPSFGPPAAANIVSPPGPYAQRQSVPSMSVKDAKYQGADRGSVYGAYLAPQLPQHQPQPSPSPPTSSGPFPPSSPVPANRPANSRDPSPASLAPRLVSRPRTSPEAQGTLQPVAGPQETRRRSFDDSPRDHDVEATIRVARRPSDDASAHTRSPRSGSNLQEAFAPHEEQVDQEGETAQGGAGLQRNDSVESTASTRSFVARMKEMYLVQKAQVDEMGRNEIRRRQDWSVGHGSAPSTGGGVAALAHRYSSYSNTPTQAIGQPPKPRHVSEPVGFVRDGAERFGHSRHSVAIAV